MSSGLLSNNKFSTKPAHSIKHIQAYKRKSSNHSTSADTHKVSKEYEKLSEWLTNPEKMTLTDPTLKKPAPTKRMHRILITGFSINCPFRNITTFLSLSIFNLDYVNQYTIFFKNPKDQKKFLGCCCLMMRSAGQGMTYYLDIQQYINDHIKNKCIPGYENFPLSAVIDPDLSLTQKHLKEKFSLYLDWKADQFGHKNLFTSFNYESKIEDYIKTHTHPIFTREDYEKERKQLNEFKKQSSIQNSRMDPNIQEKMKKSQVEILPTPEDLEFPTRIFATGLPRLVTPVMLKSWIQKFANIYVYVFAFENPDAWNRHLGCMSVICKSKSEMLKCCMLSNRKISKQPVKFEPDPFNKVATEFIEKIGYVVKFSTEKGLARTYSSQDHYNRYLQKKSASASVSNVIGLGSKRDPKKHHLHAKEIFTPPWKDLNQEFLQPNLDPITHAPLIDEPIDLMKCCLDYTGLKQRSHEDAGTIFEVFGPISRIKHSPNKGEGTVEFVKARDAYRCYLRISKDPFGGYKPKHHMYKITVKLSDKRREAGKPLLLEKCKAPLPETVAAYILAHKYNRNPFTPCRVWIHGFQKNNYWATNLSIFYNLFNAIIDLPSLSEGGIKTVKDKSEYDVAKIKGALVTCSTGFEALQLIQCCSNIKLSENNNDNLFVTLTDNTSLMSQNKHFVQYYDPIEQGLNLKMEHLDLDDYMDPCDVKDKHHLIRRAEEPVEIFKDQKDFMHTNLNEGNNLMRHLAGYVDKPKPKVTPVPSSSKNPLVSGYGSESDEEIAEQGLEYQPAKKKWVKDYLYQVDNEIPADKTRIFAATLLEEGKDPKETDQFKNSLFHYTQESAKEGAGKATPSSIGFIPKNLAGAYNWSQENPRDLYKQNMTAAELNKKKTERELKRSAKPDFKSGTSKKVFVEGVHSTAMDSKRFQYKRSIPRPDFVKDENTGQISYPGLSDQLKIHSKWASTSNKMYELAAGKLGGAFKGDYVEKSKDSNEELTKIAKIAGIDPKVLMASRMMEEKFSACDDDEELPLFDEGQEISQNIVEFSHEGADPILLAKRNYVPADHLEVSVGDLLTY